MTKRHRRHSTARKREIVEAYFNGESVRALSERFDARRTLFPIPIDEYERGEFDDDALEQEPPPESEKRIALLERLVSRQALENEFSKEARRRKRPRQSGLPQCSQRFRGARARPAPGRRHHLVAMGADFVYLAVILNAWSRRVIRYGLDRN